MRDSHDPRAPGSAPNSAAPNGSAPEGPPPHKVTQADIAWLARIFAGRSPAEIVQLKAVFDAFAAAAPPPAIPEPAQIALLDVTDDLDHMRALIIALDMAFADLHECEFRQALSTLSDTILTRLQSIRTRINEVRNPGREGAEEDEKERKRRE
jgi:hypothetical protein